MEQHVIEKEVPYSATERSAGENAAQTHHGEVVISLWDSTKTEVRTEHTATSTVFSKKTPGSTSRAHNRGGSTRPEKTSSTETVRSLWVARSRFSTTIGAEYWSQHLKLDQAVQRAVR